MRQVFRLMGKPDRVIAFDELPDRLLEGLEMREPAGLSRAWKSWLGVAKRVTKIAPERDPITAAIRTFAPIVEEGPYFYMIDEELNKDMERWSEIADYLRRNAPVDFRLKDRIEDMALPLAADIRSEVTLEPEDVPVIPLRKEVPQIVTPQGGTITEFSAEKEQHSCENKGRGGRYAPEGECKRCDQIRAEKAVAAQ